MEMFPRLPAILFFAVLFISSRGMAENNCTCPTVKADGKGNSSCSAAESGGRCTIDYNLFTPEREQRAVDLLRSVAGDVQVALLSDGMDSATALRSAAGDHITIPVLLVYLAVAAADQNADYPDTINDSELGRIAMSVAGDRSAAIAEAFSVDNISKWENSSQPSFAEASGYIILDEGTFVLAPGCVEAKEGELWVMFKASWSPVARLPRCGSQ